MIVCTSCGTRNEDGESFCGECGSYLEWAGERLAEPEPQAAAEPEPQPAPVEQAPAMSAPAEPTVPAPVERTAAAVDAPPARHAADAVAESPVAEPPVAVAATPPVAAAAPLVVPLAPAAPEDHAPPVGSDAIGTRRPGTVAEGGPVGVAGPAIAAGIGPVPPGAPSQPKAVRPGAAAPKPRRRELPPEERAPAPGETICGSCGAGNAPTRKFCRRCGTDLTDAVVAARPSWWRRLFAGRQHSAPVAGARPKYRRKRSYRGPIWLVGVLVVLAAAAVATRPYWSGASNSVLDRVKGTKAVNPIALAASSAAKGHPASAVNDGAPNVYWAPAAVGPKAVGQSVTATFAAPFRLVYLRVFDGASDQLKDYLAASSVQEVDVTLAQQGGGHVVKRFTLADKPGSQDLHVAVDNVTGVTFTIDSIYTHDQAGASAPVALGELEFLARK